MSLKWDDYAAIAVALNDAYPEADTMNIDKDTLLDMICELEDFDDEEEVDDATLDLVMFSWINLEGPDGTEHAQP